MRRITPCLAVLLLTLLFTPASSADPLPNTAPLTADGNLAAKMVEGIDRFLLAQTEGSILRREAHWKRDGSTPDAYRKSVEPNRKRLARILGVVEERVKFDAPELIATTRHPSLVARSPAFEVHAVRWPVIGGIYGEGLLLTPTGRTPVADVVAIPDADQTPEQIAGLAPGVRTESQFARRLAEAGCRVIVPALISRDDTYSMPPSGQKTNQPHREYVYRPAYEMGRHVIGYEVQKVLAAVDWFARESGEAAAPNASPAGKIAVAGYGEGGMLALYAGALDERIAVTAVSGYFRSRQGLWHEPIYRNLFGLLSEFGDAEIGSLICPRSLVIDKSAAPIVDGPPPPRDGRKGAAPGKLAGGDPVETGQEIARMHKLTDGRLPPFVFVVSPEDGAFMSDAAVEAITRKLVRQPQIEDGKIAPPQPLRQDFGVADRQRRMIDQMHAHTQQVVRDSEEVRKAFWSQADLKSRDPQKWRTSVEPYRKRFYDEVIGRFDDKLLPANPRTRKIYDDPKFTGYEVMLDVFPDVYAHGILLVPKGMKENERRPVVVCQHGLEGRPEQLADPKVDHTAYHAFAVRLAERGFITFSPQNPYIGQDKFRTLQRKLNPLGKTLFSVIVPQHQQITDWLVGLPFVNPQRIGFYGLSYGGKTAMRIPPLVDRYCLSICSADFNEWTWKNTSITWPGGYPGTGEYEMFEWNLGNTFGYFEMTCLIAPKPFMVERGHRDGVAPDEWVAYEYAKVRRLYADLKIPEKTEIEFFDGPHTIHGKGTYQFLHRHLNWPELKH